MSASFRRQVWPHRLALPRAGALPRARIPAAAISGWYGRMGLRFRGGRVDDLGEVPVPVDREPARQPFPRRGIADEREVVPAVEIEVDRVRDDPRRGVSVLPVLEQHHGDDLRLLAEGPADPDEPGVVIAMRVLRGPGLAEEVPPREAAQRRRAAGPDDAPEPAPQELDLFGRDPEI